MASLDIQRKAIDAMTIMNVAVTNIRLYPPTSAIIRNTVNRVYQIILDILKKESSVIFAESGKSYVICGQMFSEQDQFRFPQARAFLDLLSKCGIKSLSFERRIGKPELKSFLKMISRTPEEIDAAGGLPALIKGEKFPNIIIDHKVYVVVDHEQQIFASLDIQDEEIVRHVVGEDDLPEEDREKLRELAKDPKWVNQVFQAGMAYITNMKASASYQKLSDVVGHMIRTIDELSQNIDRDKISADLARSIAEMDDDMLLILLSQESEGMFSDALFSKVIDHLDDRKFERIASSLKSMEEEQAETTGPATTEKSSARLAYEQMMETVKGQRLQQRIQERLARDKVRREKEAARIRNALGEILRGKQEPLSDPSVMNVLPEYVERLYAVGKTKSADAIIEALSRSLSHPEVKIRRTVSETLSHIGRILLSDNRNTSMLRVMPMWLRWIAAETDPPTHACHRICHQLQDLAQFLILKRRMTEAQPVLATFNRICYGKIQKDEAYQNLAESILQELAADDILEVLLDAFQKPEEPDRSHAIQCITELGEYSLDMLLSILLKSRDMSERVRILQLISEIGDPVTRPLLRKIRDGGPWYYLRNLILILGKIGSEEHLNVLVPLLSHEDFRVQRESLNTIYNIGGKYRGQILLNALPAGDERMKMSIVDMLGALRYKKAVPILIDLLESRSSFFSVKTSDRLKEKICQALGRIGSVEAVPTLRSVAEQKSLLGIKAYADSVREAAVAALNRIVGERKKERKSIPDAEAIKPLTRQKAAQGQPKGPQKPVPAATAAGTGLTELELSTGFTLGAAPSDKTIQRDNDTIEDSVVGLLYKSIVKYAREKNFEKAESLRQQLIETDAMALTEIIRSGEIIEAEKNESEEVEQDHLSIWADLYDTLTPEEANTLYYSLGEAVYEADQTIFSQGEKNNRLFFIRKGQLKLSFTRGERENLLKVVEKGDIVGAETFFSVTVCTTTLTAISQVKLNFLSKEILSQWENDFPALESKLHDYCLRLDRIHDILKNKGMDRRTQKRFPLKGIISVQILTSSGSPTGKTFNGSLLDISSGGISFFIKTDNRRNISLLLGRKLGMALNFPVDLARKMNMKVSLPAGKSRIRIHQIGTVIGVSHRREDEYAIHIKFDAQMHNALAAAAEQSEAV